jgi:hypothetical protein
MVQIFFDYSTALYIIIIQYVHTLCVLLVLFYAVVVVLYGSSSSLELAGPACTIRRTDV